MACADKVAILGNMGDEALQGTCNLFGSLAVATITQSKSEEPTSPRSPRNDVCNRIDILVQAQRLHGYMGAGTVHHIAFRAPSDSAQLEWREVLSKVPLSVTAVLDRTYFHSIYFREPGGALFEIATDPPGFTFDEPVEHLGEGLKLPAWLERRRANIERALIPIDLPHLRKEQADA